MIARLLLFFALFLTGQAFAEETPAPISLEGGRVIAAAEAKLLHDRGEALFIDVRNPLNYGRGHIPSALAAHFEDKDGDGEEKEAFLKKLPGDKNAPVVIYSHGETGWKSYRAALAAVKAGYRNIMWMREGIKGWTSKGYGVSLGPETNS